MSKAKSDDTSKAAVSSQVTAVDQREFVRDKDLIERRIKMTYPDASDFTYEPNISNSVIGATSSSFHPRIWMITSRTISAG
jgi:hypothetical protein